MAEEIDYDVDEFIDYCTSKNLSTEKILEIKLDNSQNVKLTVIR